MCAARGALYAVRVGCAGWSLPRAYQARFPAEASHLERYGHVFAAVEMNSSFYREHGVATYRRWAASVRAGFRFAVKVPREITHVHRLTGTAGLLRRFLEGPRALGRRLGPLLVQLLPSLGFDTRRARTFFGALERLHRGLVVCESRHAEWFGPEAAQLLAHYRVARVAADPPPVEGADVPAGWSRLVYYRLHGRPRKYYSAYDDAYLAGLAERFIAHGQRVEVWCIFDNTAAGAATANALRLVELVEGGRGPR